MTKITEHIKQAAGKTLCSLEIIPPTKGSNIKDLLNDIEPMMDLNPPFIDVTFHREEYFEKEMPDGTKKKIVSRKRPGTVGICSSIMQRFKIDPVPHVLCGGFNKDEVEDILIDLHYLGIDNVLALRGDAAKPYNTFKAKEGGHAYAAGLVQQINDMNVGKYLHEETEYLASSNFCVGVAAYPEKHFEATSFDADFEYLKQKVAAGADYIVTQMFFDNQKYFNFVEQCRAAGINVPIIPGLKVLTTMKQLTILPKIFYLEMPTELREAVLAVESDKAAKQVGIEWCIQQSKELMTAGVPVLHYYTMSKSDAVMAVAKAVF